MRSDFFKKLLDNASDLIWAIDMEGKFLYINDNIKEWGYDKDELIGQPLLNILKTKHIGKREAEPTMLGLTQTMEMEIVDKRGLPHRVVVKSSPLHDDDGNIIGVMGIIRDVTEIQKLLEKLKNEERLASLGRLATGIAHEIRNPLSSVKMNLSILKKRLNPTGVDVEHFEIAQEETENLERIVTELLEYAKPISLKLRRQNVHNAIDSAIATAGPILGETGVSMVRRFSGEAPMVLFDRTKIHQALLNILINAIQAAADRAGANGGAKVEVATEHSTEPIESVRIYVKDNGKGIEPDDLKFVFDPFFTTKKNGTGLGLSIVRNIIDNHKGAISVDSEPGEGTTVLIELPVS